MNYDLYGKLSDFVQQFEDSLAVEYRFVEDIAHGLEDARTDGGRGVRMDVVARHLDQLYTAVNYVVQAAAHVAAAPVGAGFIVDLISNQLKKHVQDKNNTRIHNFVSDLTKHKPEKRSVFFAQIAREVMYRYGPAIAHFLTLEAPQGNQNQGRALDVLARIGAIRIIYYALNSNVSFENCEQLVSGLVEGFSGYKEGDLLSQVFRGVIYIVDPNNRMQLIPRTAEGLYTECGYMCPSGNMFYINSDAGASKKQSSRNAKRSGVTFTVESIDKSKYGRTPSQIAFKDPSDMLVPEYGYMAMPNTKAVELYAFRRHRPSAHEAAGDTNVHVAHCKNFKFRYVSYEYIKEYLRAMRVNKDLRTPFRDWLVATHGDDFGNGQDLRAMFRGYLNGDWLGKEELSFADGYFTHCDFSYCQFENITFSSVQRSVFVGCTFTNCTATAAVFTGCDLSLCKVERCKWQGLKGMVRLNFSQMFSSDFSDFNVKLPENVGIEMDDFTLDTFSSSIDTNGNSASSTVNQGISSLREKLLEERLLRELEEQKRANQETIQQQRNLIEQMNAKQETRNQAFWSAKMEEWEQHMKNVNTNNSDRMNAVDSKTLSGSINQIVMPNTSNDNPMAKIMEALFFLKPTKMLKLVQNNGDMIKWHSLPRRYDYSTSGSNGDPGADGESGTRGCVGGGSGSDGTSGVNGQHGTSAMPNTVSIMSVPDQKIFVLSTNAPNDDAVILPLLDGKVKINLTALGGAGGAGGKGGAGGDGTKGRDGQNASSGSAGTSGSNGGNGGRGGNGGMGGNAGHSADIQVLVKTDDIDLLTLLGKTSNEAIKGGAGGSLGLGGKGGNGGDGGAGYRYFDSANNRYVSIPGGSGGAAGLYGNNGRDGQPGIDGKPGGVTYTVVHMASGEVQNYRSLYKMEVQSHAPFYTLSGIIEPGQKIEVTKVVLLNSGGMPSPNNMVVSLKGNAVILIDDDRCSWKVTETVLASRTLELPGSNFFKIAQGLRPANASDVLCQTSQLLLQGKLPRIDAFYPAFHPRPISFLIMHPVEVSIVCGMRCCIFGSNVPVVITVRNKTRLGLGMNSAYGRLLRVTLKLPIGLTAEEGNHTFRAADSGSGTSFTSYSTNTIVYFDIDYLAPQGELVLSGTLVVSNSKAKLYDQIPMEYSLWLGHIESPLQASSMEVVQQMSYSFQIAEYCQPITDQDCLLVISSSTSAVEVAYWKQCFSILGKSICVFNVSLYLGLSYNHPMFNFGASLKDRIVVILNAPFIRDDKPEYLNKLFYPLDYLEEMEMFEAARRHGVRTLVVNIVPPNTPSTHHTNFGAYLKPTATFSHGATKVFDGRNGVYEHIVEQGATRDDHLPEQYMNCTIKLFRALSKPTENDFNQRMDVLAGKVADIRPDQQFFVFKAYHEATKSTQKKNFFWSRYDIGEVQIRRGLDTTYATMASKVCLRVESLAVDKARDLFTLLKLCPLKEKFRLFTVINPEEVTHKLVEMAIASDIADEQSVFLTYVRNNGAFGTNKLRMLPWLTALNTLISYDFSEMAQSSTGATALTGLLCKLTYMAQQYGSNLLWKSTNFMSNELKTACETIGTNVLHMNEVDYKAAIQKYNAAQPLAEEQVVIDGIRDPYALNASGVSFNHYMTPKSKIITTIPELKSPSTVSQMRTVFPDMSDDKLFREAVGFYSKNPTYKLQQLPTLYPMNPAEKVIPEDGNSRPSYFVRGNAPTVVIPPPAAPQFTPAEQASPRGVASPSVASPVVSAPSAPFDAAALPAPSAPPMI